MTLGFYMRNWVNSKKATFDGLQKRVDEMRKNINTYLQAKTERNTTNIRKQITGFFDCFI